MTEERAHKYRLQLLAVLAYLRCLSPSEESRCSRPSEKAVTMIAGRFERQLRRLAHLDQLVTEADAVLADPADEDDHPATREIREMLNDMRASVENKIDVLTDSV